MGKIIGIDLGTTNSVVTVIENGEATVITNSEGGRTTPSVVAVDKNGERLVGTVAKRQAVTNPLNTVFSVKRLIGRKFSEVSDEIKNFPFKVSSNGSGEPVIAINGKDYRPAELSSMILAKMKKTAEDYLGETVQEAVITVPAYFNDAQRQATKDAGRIAGLEVKRIINEPTAAALAYGLDKKKKGKVVVFDFGGGTFDVSILELQDGVFEVLSTNGDTHLGGDDFDKKIIDWMAAEFKKKEGIDLSSDPMAMQRLKEAAEKAKIELSTTVQANVNLPFLTADQNGPKHLDLTLTRAKFESLTDDLIKRAMGPVEKALADADLKINQIDSVILVGGMTRMPRIHAEVERFFGQAPDKSVNPDEVVALGAAIQGGVLTGDVKDVLLLDVTPLSLGIETLGGVTTTLIERNSTVPTQKTQVFSTAADSQTQVDIHVLQGEREMAVDNKTIGRFALDGIPPAPRGTPQIEVVFDIDANGILNVSAKDLASGKQQNIRIEASGGLSEVEIQRMVDDARANEAGDKEKKRQVEVRNRADSVLFQSEKQLGEFGEKLSSESRNRMQAAIGRLKEALKSVNESEIESPTGALEQVWQEASKEMYEQTAQSQTPPEDPSESNGEHSDAGPIDADFEEVKAS